MATIASQQTSSQPTSSSNPGQSSGANAASPSMAERDPLQIDHSLSRIQTHKGVQGVMVLTWEGNVVRSNLDNVMTIQYSNVLLQLATLARNAVRDLDPENDLRILRLRTKKQEMMIAPAKQYVIIILQSPEDQP